MCLLLKGIVINVIRNKATLLSLNEFEFHTCSRCVQIYKGKSINVSCLECIPFYSISIKLGQRPWVYLFRHFLLCHLYKLHLNRICITSQMFTTSFMMSNNLCKCNIPINF